MIIEILNKLNEMNENLFAGFDGIIESFGMPEWLCDAIVDSFHILPLLFLVFFIIEVVEFFYSEKINDFMKKSEKAATLIGSLAAVIPQCGFSVIASTLYLRRFITKGTLIAIYLTTSDEAIPILLAQPTHTHYVIPIIGVKLFIGIIAGYLIDFILKDDKYVFSQEDTHESHEHTHDHECECDHEHEEEDDDDYDEISEGCCHHSVSHRRKRELIYHPLKHTLNIFLFILGITILLNYVIEFYSTHASLHIMLGNVKLLEPVITAFIGLIPNCAISIALTMLLIKGSISFGAVMSGLLSNAGLGILVLFRHSKNFKDSFKIVGILLTISIISGLLIQLIA